MNPQQRTVRIAAALTAAVATLGLSACGSSGGGGGGGGKGAFCSGGQTKIAFAGPVSGPEATYGQQQQDGLKLAVKDFNASGGFSSGPLKGCKVTIDGPFDDRSDASTGATIATKVATDSSVLAYFGDVDSSVSLAALPILSRAGIPMINSYSSNVKLTDGKYKNIFRVILNDDTQGGGIASLLTKDFGKKKLAVVWPNDAFGQGISAAFLDEAKKNGAEVPVSFSYADDSTDFSVAISKIQAAKVDAVALLGVYSTDAVILKQLNASGITAKTQTIMGNASDNSSQYITIAGANAANGSYLVGIWDPSHPNAAGTKFISEFKAAYNLDPAEDAATAYDAFFTFVKAVNAGASDRKSLIDEMHKITPSNPYKGITNSIGFDANGQTVAAKPSLLQIVDGKIVGAKAP